MPLLPPLLLSSLLAGVIAGEGSDSAAEQAQLPYDGPQYMAVKKNGKVIHGDMVGFEGTGKPMLADPVAVFLVKLGAPEAEAMEIRSVFNDSILHPPWCSFPVAAMCFLLGESFVHLRQWPILPSLALNPAGH